MTSIVTVSLGHTTKNITGFAVRVIHFGLRVGVVAGVTGIRIMTHSRQDPGNLHVIAESTEGFGGAIARVFGRGNIFGGGGVTGTACSIL